MKLVLENETDIKLFNLANELGFVALKELSKLDSKIPYVKSLQSYGSYCGEPFTFTGYESLITFLDKIAFESGKKAEETHRIIKKYTKMTFLNRLLFLFKPSAFL